MGGLSRSHEETASKRKSSHWIDASLMRLSAGNHASLAAVESRGDVEEAKERLLLCGSSSGRDHDTLGLAGWPQQIYSKVLTAQVFRRVRVLSTILSEMLFSMIYPVW